LKSKHICGAEGLELNLKPPARRIIVFALQGRHGTLNSISLAFFAWYEKRLWEVVPVFINEVVTLIFVVGKTYRRIKVVEKHLRGLSGRQF